MLPIETANLPQDERRRLHPDFLANEQAYLSMRDTLLATYAGQWVAIADGRVVASGSRLLEVMNRADEVAEHAFIARVGAERATVFRVRRAVFAYDSSYQPFPMPRLTATLPRDRPV